MREQMISGRLFYGLGTRLAYRICIYAAPTPTCTHGPATPPHVHSWPGHPAPRALMARPPRPTCTHGPATPPRVHSWPGHPAPRALMARPPRPACTHGPATPPHVHSWPGHPAPRAQQNCFEPGGRTNMQHCT